MGELSPCPNKEVCGSCAWSHIPYEKQLTQKLSDINGSFKLKELPHRVEEILPSPVTAHYRNRMDFVIDFEGRFGMRQKGKWWKVIDQHHCFLADEQIDTFFDGISGWLKTAGLSFFDRKAHTGLLRYAVIRATKHGETMITIVTSAPDTETTESTEMIVQTLNQLAETLNPTTLIWSINHTVSDVSFGEELRTISGPGVIQETISDVTYEISPNAFFQTNSHGAELLLQAVKEGVGDLSDKTLLDLYCGSGFFSIALSESAKRTIGVELVPDAIRDAKRNAELNDVSVEFHDAKTEEFSWKELGADVVILDPPRSGMHDNALKDVLDAKPKRIVYVSCNYKNFARELVKLQEFYDVERMVAIDMFPHTPHVELVSTLTLKG